MKKFFKEYEAPCLSEYPVSVEAGICLSGQSEIIIDDPFEDYGGVPTETIF